jgi:hypothetical protein
MATIVFDKSGCGVVAGRATASSIFLSVFLVLFFSLSSASVVIAADPEWTDPYTVTLRESPASGGIWGDTAVFTWQSANDAYVSPTADRYMIAKVSGVFHLLRYDLTEGEDLGAFTDGVNYGSLVTDWGSVIGADYGYGWHPLRIGYLLTIGMMLGFIVQFTGECFWFFWNYTVVAALRAMRF